MPTHRIGGVAQRYARLMHTRPSLRRNPGVRPRTTARLTAALFTAAALLVSACSSGSSTTSAGGGADTVLAALPRATPSALSSYYERRSTGSSAIHWLAGDCSSPVRAPAVPRLLMNSARSEPRCSKCQRSRLCPSLEDLP